MHKKSEITITGIILLVNEANCHVNKSVTVETPLNSAE